MAYSALFRLDGQVAVVTGGSGVLPSAMARALVDAGARVALLGRTQSTLDETAASLGSAATAIAADVTARQTLESARERVLETFGRVDILINGAGGNAPAATTNDDRAFFDLAPEAVRSVLDVNFTGTFLACQVFGAAMAAREGGVVLNISSMAASRPLTRVSAYSAAKAAVDSLTQWLAVHMAQTYAPQIRVNAIAPGFFVGEQNRRLLLNEDGSLTARGQQIIDHTPMARFGEPTDLVGTTLWLCSPASRFVTGVVVPVDGGFSAFGGV